MSDDVDAVTESFHDYDFHDDPFSAAQERGQVVVTPTDHELFVDIDNEEQWDVFMRQMGILQRVHPNATWKSTPSRSNGYHRHVVVTLPGRTLSPGERIMLQAVLGSDPVREILSVFRMWRGVEHPTRFFETP